MPDIPQYRFVTVEEQMVQQADNFIRLHKAVPQVITVRLREQLLDVTSIGYEPMRVDLTAQRLMDISEFFCVWLYRVSKPGDPSLVRLRKVCEVVIQNRGRKIQTLLANSKRGVREKVEVGFSRPQESMD